MSRQDHPARSLRQEAVALSGFDRLLINALQGDFPLSSSPFDVLAQRLGVPAEDLVAGVEDLMARGVITRFGPLFNIEQLGGVFSLCALKVPPQRYEEVTRQVNAYPQVAHNYQRRHAWNMWFVLATESAEELDETFENIVRSTDCPGLNLPKEKEFYVGLRLEA